MNKMNKYKLKIIVQLLLMFILVFLIFLKYGNFIIIGMQVMFIIMWSIVGIAHVLKWIGIDVGIIKTKETKKSSNKIIVVCSCGNREKFTEIYGDDYDNEMRCDVCGYQGVIDNVDEFECK